MSSNLPNPALVRRIGPRRRERRGRHRRVVAARAAGHRTFGRGLTRVARGLDTPPPRSRAARLVLRAALVALLLVATGGAVGAALYRWWAAALGRRRACRPCGHARALARAGGIRPRRPEAVAPGEPTPVEEAASAAPELGPPPSPMPSTMPNSPAIVEAIVRSLTRPCPRRDRRVRALRSTRATISRACSARCARAATPPRRCARSTSTTGASRTACWRPRRGSRAPRRWWR